MTAHFRIIRLKDRFRIDIRVMFMYCPCVYVLSFQDCFGFISNYCYCCYNKAIILDAEGPNKRMVIKYNERELYYFRNKFNQVKFVACESTKLIDVFFYLEDIVINYLSIPKLF